MSSVLLAVVIIIMVEHDAPTVVFQLRHRDRGAFKIAPEIFHIVQCPAGLFGKIHFPITFKLGIKVTATRWIIANVSKARQCVRLELKIAVSKELNDLTAPGFFDVFHFEKIGFHVSYFDRPPRVTDKLLIELATVGVRCAKIPISSPRRLACLSIARLAQQKSQLSNSQLLLKKDQSR